MITLVGTGGHAKVVFESMLMHVDQNHNLIIVRDDVASTPGRRFMGLEVETPALLQDMNRINLHVAIGNNVTRQQMLTEGCKRGAYLYSIIHKKSYVCDPKAIGAGSFVASGAIVSVHVSVGDGVIINHNAVVDHDCLLGNFCHVAPGAVLCGNVTLGKRVMIGARAVVLPNIIIGDDVIVGAGSVVTKSIQQGKTWIGNKLA
tara:strand:+ start:150 stop:758 length:609 start_codon:yes stop_codon:yes gene_type:complete